MGGGEGEREREAVDGPKDFISASNCTYTRSVTRPVLNTAAVFKFIERDTRIIYAICPVLTEN